ncbi:sensor histidine kinase [Massilia yuzhufengensis]|uniref:Virulence sensor protein BvgS n=1 Tax=Massilia yuzhufengensis TaxID=1164594 RepID=A0A1I1T934_9BURK|nr:ATP-binding protein [Massilia yuzhufengensis]SFD55095.1 Signal transduction histidine kinase [Massilia yuzhufengensis]
MQIPYPLLVRIRTAPLVIALCCFSAVWIADVWYSLARQDQEAHQRALRDAGRDAGNFARMIEEHTVRTIRAGDQALQFIRHEYIEHGARLDLSSLLDKGVIPGDIVNLYSVVGPDGQLVLASKPSPPLSLADRAHIRSHLEQPGLGLIISKPVLGRITHQWSLQLTRRIDLADGSLGGVAAVSLDPFYFTRLYESAQISPNSVVTLVGTDGIVRARRSTDASTLGQDVSASAQFRQIGGRRNGLVTVRSNIDGRKRLAAFRRLDAYPLIVVVGIDLSDLDDHLLALRSQQILHASLSTVGIVVFSAVLLLLARRLLLSRAQAVKANAAKTQFLSNMSHELRTPLNGILGYAELLSMDARDAEHREYAEVIRSSGLHLLSLVDQLLQLNRLEAGTELPQLASEDLRALVEQVVSGHHGAARARGLALLCRIGEDVPQRWVCDREKLRQVLDHLLHNAIRFTDAGQVELALEAAEDRLVFTVADTGPGIPASAQERVFDRFFQVDSSDTRSSDGAGLGLTLVRELLALMGGEVEIKSAPGIGTTVVFTLPRTPGDGMHGRAARSSEETA